jgi:di/tricarboxylate transporter
MKPGRASHQKIGLVIGPVLSVAMLLSDAPEGLTDSGWSAAALGVLMAVWWASEAVPIAVTALLPLVCFPLLGVASIQDTASPFANKVIYLFLGGFIVALAMQRWDLQCRWQGTFARWWVHACQRFVKHVGTEHVNDNDAAADRGVSYHGDTQLGSRSG